MQDKRRIIIGLDFGTAYTKAVIRDSVSCYAVQFNQNMDSNKYLQPSEIYVGNDFFSLINKKDTVKIRNLKIRILEERETNEELVETAIFIALILCKCRDWLIKNYGDIYNNYDLDWYLNVGIPTENYHNVALKNKYKQLALAGWALSLEKSPITSRNAQRIYSEIESNSEDITNKKGMIPPSNIELFPEFVAQISGYVRSPLRRPDLHMLMDVGAGTVDLSMFNVHKNQDGDAVFPIFSKSVHPMGSQFLCRHRLGKTGRNQEVDSTKNVMSIEHVAGELGINAEKLNQIDNPFRQKICGFIVGHLREVRKHKYPNSPRWQTGVPIFLCGGGSKIDFYNDCLSAVEEIVSKSFNINICQALLPKPDELIAPGLEPDNYDRMSVAYGLSYDAYDIGKIIEDPNRPATNPPSAPVNTGNALRAPRIKKVCICGGRNETCHICNGFGYS